MPRIDELFRCPKCGGSRLEEVMADVTVASQITMLDEGGDAVYGDQTNDDGEVVRYQCIDCGWVIDGVRNTEELHEYLGTPGKPGCLVPDYSLTIDGPAFRRQRELLLKLRTLRENGISDSLVPGDIELLDGLVNLTDELADQAQDRHGIDCLLDPEPCECEKPGYFCSGIPGILAHIEDGRLAPEAKVERCDLCRRYPTDEAALARLRELGHAPP